MKKTKAFLPVGIILLVIGLPSLVSEKDFAFGLVFTLPALVLLFLYFRAELRRKTAKPIGVMLVLLFLFFSYMGLSDLGENPFGAAVGFSVALPLLLEILLRLRSRRLYPKAEEQETQPPAAAPVRSSGPVRREQRVRRCPSCGAPGRGDSCEYCGGPL